MDGHTVRTVQVMVFILHLINQLRQFPKASTLIPLSIEGVETILAE